MVAGIIFIGLWLLFSFLMANELEVPLTSIVGTADFMYWGFTSAAIALVVHFLLSPYFKGVVLNKLEDVMFSSRHKKINQAKTLLDSGAMTQDEYADRVAALRKR